MVQDRPGVDAPAEPSAGRFLVSDARAREPAVRTETVLEDPLEHRRRTARQERHTARTKLHVLSGDDEALEDADLQCPSAPHDLGRKNSTRRSAPKPGRRAGFKVWKTPFWKRRRALWAARNEAARRVGDDEA
jgi:hypothetical protein